MTAQLDYLTSRMTAVLREVLVQPRPPLKMDPIAEPGGLFPETGAQGFTNYNAATRKLTILGIELRGEAERQNLAATEGPITNVDQSQMEIGTETYELSGRWDDDEVDMAQRFSRNPPSEKMLAARLGVEEKHDDKAFLEFSNNSNVAVLNNITNALDGALTDEQVGEAIAELGKSIDQMDIDSRGRFTCTHVCLPSAVYNNISSLERDTKNRSIKETLEQRKDVTFIKMPALADAGTKGRIVYIDGNYPRQGMNLRMWMREYAPIMVRAGIYEQTMRLRSAGFAMPIPAAFRYEDGVLT